MSQYPGQLGFVAAVLLLERLLSHASIAWPRWLTLAPGYAVGAMGAFWTLQRLDVIRLSLG